MEIELSTQTLMYVVGGVLLLGGAAALTPSTLKVFGEWLNEGEVTEQVTAAKAAPAGWREYCDTILAACEHAPDNVKLDYLIGDYTETEVLRLEVGRLTETPTT